MENALSQDSEKKDRSSSSGKIPFWKRRRFVLARSFLVNLLIFVATYYMAFVVKGDSFVLRSSSLAIFRQTICWVVAIKLIVLFASRTFRSVSYYGSMSELRSIIVNSTFAFASLVLFFPLCDYFGFHIAQQRLSVLFVDLVLTVLIRGGLRICYRLFFDTVNRMRESDDEPVLFLGANEICVHTANTLNSRRNSGYRVVGFVTLHKEKVGLTGASLPIIGHIDDVVKLAKEQNVKTVLCVAGVLTGAAFRKIYTECDKNGIVVKVVPQVEFLPDTKLPIHEIDVNDLLGRDPIKLDDQKIRELISNRRVLVTGAGGSIGSEICRQLSRFEPKELFLLGRGENRIFFLERELRKNFPEIKFTPVIANITDAPRIDLVFSQIKPEIVFHAAAHKHVPLMEANVPEAVRNNIYGSKVVADAADKYGAKKFVMISTDKAVNPSSVMGCSKQMAERYVNALAQRSQTKFIVTRFGNVLGSAGSVVPIFKEQIRNGGPITITDKRMTRFFMTIPEAAQLVLDAAAFGNGGEIFVLDMGEPVKIMDLAKDLIRLSGLPEKAVEIQEVGLRPGEKLYEELYFESEKAIPTTQKKVFAAQHRQFELDLVQAQLDELLSMANEPHEKIREKMREFVPEFKPTFGSKK